MMAAGNEGQDQPRPAALAKAAAVESVVSNLAVLAIVLAVQVAVARRQEIVRAYFTAVGRDRQDARRGREARALAEFGRDISEISHAGGSLTDE